MTVVAQKHYRRLTAVEKAYIVNNWEDRPEVIQVIASHLLLTTKQLRSHARYLNLTSRDVRHSWTDAELQLLDFMAETKPLHVLVGCWNRSASREGRPTRTVRAIEKKLLERGHSTKVQINYISVPAIALLLNRSESWVKSLIENGKLKASKQGSHWVVKVKYLRIFVFEHPFDSTCRLGTEGFADLLLAIKD